MEYLCRKKPLEKMSHDEVHEELKSGWNVFNALAGSIYKDVVWDDLRELDAKCDCPTNETRTAMQKLVKDAPQFFW